MIEETPLVAPLPAGALQVVMPPPLHLAPDHEALPAVTPAQAEAVEAVFTEETESSAVMGVIGMWTGTLLLHDLAVEHFQRPADEEEETEMCEKRKRRLDKA